MIRLALSLMLLIAVPLLAAERVQIRPATEDVTVDVLSATASETLLRVQVNAFVQEEVVIDGQAYLLLDCDKEGVLLNAGEPALPHIARSIIIPDMEDVNVHVVESEYQDYLFTRVAPSKGNLLRTVNPETVPYAFGAVYNTNTWYPAELATQSEPYILRDLRGTVVDVTPFRYQPAEQTLRVYTSLTLSITVTGPSSNNVLARTAPLERMDRQFDELYRRHFVNYGLDENSRYVPVLEDGELLVITHDAFAAAVQPFVNWKIQKGIPTTLVNVSTVGNTATAIRNYIQNFYNNSGGNLAYVLLVGDAAQVATMTASGGSSDPSYAKVVGTDYYPDIFVGRFSAETIAHVQTQVERSVEYERNPEAGAAWYHTGTCIASAEGPGHFGEYDNTHESLIRTDLLGATYTAIDQIYDPGASAAQVTTALNAGRSLINYTGHGSETSFVTTGFSNGNVAALQNDNRLPFIFSVACVNGYFANFTCFAEAWLRSMRNGEPIGAIATYMSSINQSWNPPMDAQDEAADLMCAGSKTTVGGICYNASCRMIELNGAGGADMYNTWHIFGDPSLQVRTDTPAPMAVSHAAEIMFGQTSFDVNIPGVAGALCALSFNNTLYGRAYTDAAGAAVIEIADELPAGETMTLTVTGFNQLTYVGDVMVITSGPDVWPPSISFLPLPDTNDETGPYVLTATLRDFSGIAGALLHYSFDSVSFTAQALGNLGGDQWSTSFGGYAAGTTVYYYLTATDASENSNMNTSAVYSFSVLGVIFADNLENGAGEWTHAANQAGWTDQWHLSTEQSHSANHAWKFGDSGTGTYANHSDGGLISPPVYLRGEATLTFWHWIQSEISTAYPDSAYDAGVVDISVDDGAWQQLTALTPPYNKITRCSAGGGNPYTGPFACRTSCYAGDVAWTQVSAVLDAFAGHTIRLRFRFGSDAGGGREGWYVDDISIIGLPPAPTAPQAIVGLQTLSTSESVTLLWPRSTAPWYRIYSSLAASGPFETLEAATQDTFITLPTDQFKRFYIVTAATE